MAWEQDLHQLEQALAAGQLSPDDFRRRRDEVLDAVSGGRTQSIEHPRAQAPALAVEHAPTVHLDGEATQVVPGSLSDADRTQVVRNAAAPQMPPQQVSGPDPSWQASVAPPAVESPNWVNEAFGTPRQGPETATSLGAGLTRRRRAGLIALAVVVVAGLIVGRWLIFGGSSPQAGQPNPPAATSAPPTSSGPRAEIGKLVFPPGIPTPETFTASQLAQLKKLPQPDLDVLANTSLTKVDSVLSVDGTTSIDLWAFTMHSSSDAHNLASAFDSDQLRFGFATTDLTIDDGKYTAYTSQQQATSGSTEVVYRLHYVVGDQVIRVEVFDQDGAKALAEFQKVLKLQTTLTPPSK